MKGLLYFLSGCLIIGFILSTVLTVMPVFPIITKGFLVSIEQKQYPQAYKLFSTQFQKQVDMAKFIEMIQKSGLEDYREFKENANVMDKNKQKGYISGVIITKQNERFPIKIEFIQEKGTSWSDSGWHISNIKLGEEAIEKPKENLKADP